MDETMPDGRLSAAVAQPADQSWQATARTYDRIAPIYDLLDAAYERAWKAALRRELFRHARPGRLLDVGVGTGCNMPFYRPDAEVVGIDASRNMLHRARSRARRLGLEVELREMNLLELGFADASFDTVAITFVLLCLPDPMLGPALEELRRVLKPDGRLLVLDYNRSTRTTKAMRWWTRTMSGWLRWMFAARFDPPTEDYVGRAGFEVVARAGFMGHAVTMLILRPAPRAGGAAPQAD
jgi:ubiquinone/menaquinone biosynthesis C-methylase UbiE